jgi:hypothetical protein
MSEEAPPPESETGRDKTWLVIVAAAALTLGVVLFAKLRVSTESPPDAAVQLAPDAEIEPPSEPDAGAVVPEAPPSKKEGGPKHPVAGKRISAEQIRGIVKKHTRELASCYRAPSGRFLTRKVELSLIVEPSGDVSSASVVTRMPGAQEAVDCLLTRVRHWRFSAPGGTMSQEIVVPLIGIAGRG